VLEGPDGFAGQGKGGEMLLETPLKVREPGGSVLVDEMHPKLLC
jgi:hypothetical protein